MLSNILKLEGVQQLGVNEQKSISGGLPPDVGNQCPKFIRKYYNTTPQSCANLNGVYQGAGQCYINPCW
jgi:hypothetical protein